MTVDELSEDSDAAEQALKQKEQAVKKQKTQLKIQKALTQLRKISANTPSKKPTSIL